MCATLMLSPLVAPIESHWGFTVFVLTIEAHDTNVCSAPIRGAEPVPAKSRSIIMLRRLIVIVFNWIRTAPIHEGPAVLFSIRTLK